MPGAEPGYSLNLYIRIVAIIDDSLQMYIGSYSFQCQITDPAPGIILYYL